MLFLELPSATCWRPPGGQVLAGTVSAHYHWITLKIQAPNIGVKLFFNMTMITNTSKSHKSYSRDGKKTRKNPMG